MTCTRIGVFAVCLIAGNLFSADPHRHEHRDMAIVEDIFSEDEPLRQWQEKEGIAQPKKTEEKGETSSRTTVKGDRRRQLIVENSIYQSRNKPQKEQINQKVREETPTPLSNRQKILAQRRLEIKKSSKEKAQEGSPASKENLPKETRGAMLNEAAQSTPPQGGRSKRRQRLIAEKSAVIDAGRRSRKKVAALPEQPVQEGHQYSRGTTRKRQKLFALGQLPMHEESTMGEKAHEDGDDFVEIEMCNPNCSCDPCLCDPCRCGMEESTQNW